MLSWGEIIEQADLNDHAGLVSCSNGSGLLVEKEYLKKHIDSENLLRISEVADSVSFGDKECLAFHSGASLRLCICTIPELEEDYYNVCRDYTEKNGKGYYASTTILHEAFMQSVKESYPTLYSTIQDIYISNLIKTNESDNTLSEDAQQRLAEFEQSYPVAEELGDIADVDYKKAYEALRISYNKLREDYISLATKYEFIVEQVKRLQEEVQANRNEAHKAQELATKLEQEMKEYKKSITEELAEIRKSMATDTAKNSFDDLFVPPSLTADPLQDEYNKRLNDIHAVDLYQKSAPGPDAFANYFKGLMKVALTENPNRKDYVIQAAQKALNAGYEPKHIKTAISRFAPEAIKQTKDAYANWVLSKVTEPSQSRISGR